MENENIENDTLKNEQENETPNPEEDKTQEENPEEKSKDLQSALAQKEHYRSKLEKVEAEKKALEEKLANPKSESSLTLEAIKVGKKLEKYSDEIIDSVAKVIKSDNPKDILEALDNPYIKQGIEIEMKKVADTKKIPGSSGISSERDEDVAKLPKDEFRKRMIEEAKQAMSGGSGM